MTGRIASQAPFILLPRYGDRYKGMAKQIRDVVHNARQEVRSPDDLAFAEYVANTAQGRIIGRAVNKKMIDKSANGEKPTLAADAYFAAGSTIDPFFLPYKNTLNQAMNRFLRSGEIPYKGDLVEREKGIDYQDRLAAIAHIPKMMERWENLPKVDKEVYRGNDRLFAWRKSIETPKGFTSASEKWDTASIHGQFGQGQMLNIQSKTGRRIASKDGEAEIIFAPGTQFSKVDGNSQEATYQEVGRIPMSPIPTYDELKSLSEKRRIASQSMFEKQAALRNEIASNMTIQEALDYKRHKELAKGMIPKITLGYPPSYKPY